MFNLKKSAFEAWLKAKPPDNIVGIGNDCTVCPLATYLKENGWPIESIAPEGIIFENADNLATPEWAIQFMDEIDEYSDESIPARLALIVLNH